MFGAAAMSLSSFCVVTNALRLNLFKVHDASRDKKIKQNVEEIHYISANAEMKNVTENKSLKAENPDFCNSEIHDPKDQENIKENKENKEMTTITVNVTGMMCGHCEATVKKALEALEQVDEAIVSHEEGTAVVKLNSDISNDVLKKTVEDRRIDKVAPYILIYIFIKIVNWIVQMIIYGKYTSINWFVESGVAWFALAMFFMYIITFYTKRFKPVYGFVLSVVIAMILGYTVENTDIFCWMRIVNFYPFFYLGYVISIEDITKWLENKKIKVMAIISLITYFVICCVGIDKIFWLRFLLTGRSGYYRLEYGMAYGPLIRLGVYVISFFIVFMFLSIMPKRRFILSKIGQRSLSVYVFHYVFIYIYMASSLYKYLPYKYPNKWWLFIVAIGIVVTFICGTKWPDALCKWIMNSNIKYRKNAKQ